MGKKRKTVNRIQRSFEAERKAAFKDTLQRSTTRFADFCHLPILLTASTKDIPKNQHIQYSSGEVMIKRQHFEASFNTATQTSVTRGKLRALTRSQVECKQQRFTG